MMRRWGARLGAGLALSLSIAYAAPDLGAARSAYARRDFATALAEFRTLANGEGVAQNHAEAVHWYRKAAAKGNADAQRSLGMCFATGQGVAKDPVQAAVWLNLAADQQDPLAQRLRQKLEVELTPAQAAQAAELARQWSGQETVMTTSGPVGCEAAEGMQPLEIGGPVTAPRLVRKVEPVYPQQLRAAGFNMQVTLHAVVDAIGDVHDVGVVSSQNVSFSKAAIDAVKKWKFDPARREGCPVPVMLTVSVDFKSS
jgi:TonB family protein